jgi:hypothetical protein
MILPVIEGRGSGIGEPLFDLDQPRAARDVDRLVHRGHRLASVAQGWPTYQSIS